MVYAETIQGQPNLVHNVLQSGPPMLGAMGQLEPTIEQMSGHIPATHIQVIKQQQPIHQQQYRQAKQVQQFETQQQTIQEQHQQQQQQQIQHIAIQQQQQQIRSNQILTSLDLNDDSTVVYADTLQGQSGLVHNVIQTSPIMSNIDIVNEDTCMSVTNSIIQPSIQQQMSPTGTGQAPINGQLGETCSAQHQISFAQHQQIQQNQTFF